eukprot:scaffold9160_cov73-Phaeocystis_antarctica.AAC.8
MSPEPISPEPRPPEPTSPDPESDGIVTTNPSPASVPGVELTGSSSSTMAAMPNPHDVYGIAVERPCAYGWRGVEQKTVRRGARVPSASIRRLDGGVVPIPNRGFGPVQGWGGGRGRGLGRVSKRAGEREARATLHRVYAQGLPYIALAKVGAKADLEIFHAALLVVCFPHHHPIKVRSLCEVQFVLAQPKVAYVAQYGRCCVGDHLSCRCDSHLKACVVLCSDLDPKGLAVAQRDRKLDEGRMLNLLLERNGPTIGPNQRDLERKHATFLVGEVAQRHVHKVSPRLKERVGRILAKRLVARAHNDGTAGGGRR